MDNSGSVLSRKKTAISEDSMSARLQYLEQALGRLEEALAQEATNPLYLDGTIQRFEFTFELTWKALKDLLLMEPGFEVASPKQALQKAYAVGLLQEEKIWLDMLKDCNLSSHTYREELAREIYVHIQWYYPALRQLYALLSGKLKG
jgi:nucleotidyltransferase substrate binding protein (TIGR01987 family)